jgi:hypothetical protein
MLRALKEFLYALRMPQGPAPLRGRRRLNVCVKEWCEDDRQG